MTGRTDLPSGLVTFMFTDIEGSTRLARLLGAGYRPVLHEHRRVVRRVLAERGGCELFTEGDSFFAVFPDARSGLAAGLAAQRALAAHHWSTPHVVPRVRIGLHTAHAEPVAGEYASVEVHRAARIAAAAHGGQVLCSAATARHAKPVPGGAALIDLGLHRLRGFDGRERLFQLVAADLQRRFPRPRTPLSEPHNLPVAVSSFVGRRAERARLAELLAAHRLVTVVGAGGSGKTRLAVEVARDLLARFPDGVWYVDVAGQPDLPALAAEAATVLGVRPEPGRSLIDTVAEVVGARRMLLVLDTCDAVPVVAGELAMRLLSAGPGVQVLATGRQPLGAPGEVVWRVPPLPVDAGVDGTPAEAVSLLADRCLAARGGRAAAATELPTLRQVAARLDGLPLALELAATRLRVLSAQQLADRLDDVLGTVDAGCFPADGSPTGPGDRHGSLQGSVSWSYRRLPAGAARLLRRLAVFAGPVELPAVESLVDEDPLDALAALVDASLVEVDVQPAGPRYRLLAPVRAYAARRLAETGEEAAVRQRHVAWVRQAVAGVRVDPSGQPVTLSLDALGELAAEGRVALRWAATGGRARDGFALAQGLDPWWREHAPGGEARDWLTRLHRRAAETGEQLSAAELAAAYEMDARHAIAAGELADAARSLLHAELAAREARDPDLLIRVRSAGAAALSAAGRATEAERRCRDVIAAAGRDGGPGAELPAVTELGGLLWRRGRLDEAAEVLAGARPVEAAQPEVRGARTVDMLLGMVALRRGDLVAAHDHLAVALRSRARYGYRTAARDTICAVAVRCAAGGDVVTAARLFGAALGCDSRRGPEAGWYADFWAEEQGRLRAVLGDPAFDKAYAGGAALRLDDAVTEALAVEHPDLAAGSARFSAQESRIG